MAQHLDIARWRLCSQHLVAPHAASAREVVGSLVGRPAGGNSPALSWPTSVPAPRRLDRAQALAELALRYFTGHGPATERDLAYWATLTRTDPWSTPN